MQMKDLVSWFQLEYPDLVKAMKEANHHGENLNPYHLEGDIWTHAMMVCKQAENMSKTVQIAALLHDIGKPSTRAVNAKNGNVSFYNHDAVSAFMSLEILKREELGLSKEEQFRIFNVIALHTQIYKLSIEQLAKIGNVKLLEDLIDLGNADHSGRFHSKGDAVIPKINEIPFVDSGKISRQKEVVILCGLPASGKSTWTRNNFECSDKNYSTVSRDFLIEQERGTTYNEKWNNSNQNKINVELEARFRDVVKYPTVSTIVDMTHMSKKSRRRSLSHFDSSYKKKCIVFLTDLAETYLRNSKRDGKVIGEEVYDRMIRSFYPPTYEEFDEIEYVI